MFTQNDFKNTPKSKYNLPEDSQKYVGEHIVFFSDEKNPKVLFHSLNPKEVYVEAEKIGKKRDKIPTVVRITDPKKELSHLALHGS